MNGVGGTNGRPTQDMKKTLCPLHLARRTTATGAPQFWWQSPAPAQPSLLPGPPAPCPSGLSVIAGVSSTGGRRPRSQGKASGVDLKQG